MRARQVDNYGAVCILSGKRRALSLRKFIAFGLALLVIFLCLAGYFLFFWGRIGGRSYYVLMLDKAETIELARQKSDSIAAAGGSGFIMLSGDFGICGAVYRSKNDGESVRERLLNDFPLSEVASFKFGRKRVEKEVKKSTEFLFSLIDFFIDLSFSLDREQKSEAAALSEVSKKQGELALQLSGLKESNSTLFSLYQLIENEWNYISAIDEKNGIYNHRLKYFSCFLVENFYSFWK